MDTMAALMLTKLSGRKENRGEVSFVTARQDGIWQGIARQGDF